MINFRFDTQAHLVEFHPVHLEWMLAMWSCLEKEPPKERVLDETEANNQVWEGDDHNDPAKAEHHIDLQYSFPEHWEQGVKQLNLQFPRKVMEGVRKRAFNTERVN